MNLSQTEWLSAYRQIIFNIEESGLNEMLRGYWEKAVDVAVSILDRLKYK